MVIIVVLPISYLHIVDLDHIAGMDESHNSYVDDEHVDNHDYDDTDADIDNDIDDDNDDKKDRYIAAGVALDVGAAPTLTRPAQARPLC